MLEEAEDEGSMRSCSGSGDGHREPWFGGRYRTMRIVSVFRSVSRPRISGWAFRRQRGRRVRRVSRVREPPDTPRVAEGNEDGGPRTLGNFCQRCASRLLPFKAGTIYGCCNRGLGGYHTISTLTLLEQHWGFSQHAEVTGE